MKPDLTLLYSELGLRPNCSVAELQLAYRRRISQLLPRRETDASMPPETAALLRDLIWLYSAANRFHRRYGRLPGAAPVRQFPDPPHRPVFRQRYISRGAPPPDSATPGSRILVGLVVMLLALVFAMFAVVSGEWLR